MKNIIFTFALYVSYIFVSAQSHSWQWAETSFQLDNSSDGATYVGVTADADGNILVCGYFYNSSITIGNTILYNTDPSGYTSDILIAKFDPNGHALWAASAGGTSYDDAFTICTDRQGNAYITGYFVSDSISFGQSTLYNHTTNDTFYDAFVAKYSPTGNFLWAKGFGGNRYDVGNGVATDGSGNLFIAGDYQSDSVVFDQFVLYNNSPENAFLVKCDSAGNVLWVKSSTSPSIVSCYALSTDARGNAFMTGRFTGGTANFGNQVVANHQAGRNDIYLAKYDANGNALWAQDAGGALDDEPYAVATDASGSAFITGYFNSLYAYFGSQELANSTAYGASNVFIAKYDSSGALAWVNGGYGSENNVGQSIATDTSGNVYATGHFYSPTLTFANDTLHNFDPSLGTEDAFITEYDAGGNFINALSMGGVANDCGNGIATDISENIYTVGFYRSDEITFGDTTLYTSAPTHFLNPYLAKYSCVNPGTPIITQSNDTLYSSAASNNQWYLNGFAIDGATGQRYFSTQAGTYTVEVTNGPTCKANSLGFTTGISNPLQLPAISLYPNPAANWLIAESASFGNGHVSAAVYDLTGNMVEADYSRRTNQIIFNVDELPAGMYWLKLSIDGQDATAKFVKF